MLAYRSRIHNAENDRTLGATNVGRQDLSLSLSDSVLNKVQHISPNSQVQKNMHRGTWHTQTPKHTHKLKHENLSIIGQLFFGFLARSRTQHAAASYAYIHNTAYPECRNACKSACKSVTLMTMMAMMPTHTHKSAHNTQQ